MEGSEHQPLLQWRFATADDVDLLARMNRQLCEDENHPNAAMPPEWFSGRMNGFLLGQYRAVLFEWNGEPAAYALFQFPREREVYLRQFFVARNIRRQGVGRAAMRILFDDVWPKDFRLTLDVLCSNNRGVSFWRALGYRDYALTLEIPPGERPA